MASRHQSYPPVAGTPLARVVSRIYAVEEQIDAGTQYPPQRVDRFTMLLTLSGEARVKVGNLVVSHRPGTIITLAQRSDIQETAGPRRPWHVKYLMLLGPWAAAMSRVMLDRGENIFAYDPAPRRWQRVLSEAIDCAFSQGRGWQWTFASRLAELGGAFTQHPSSPGEPKGMLERLEFFFDRAPERPWRMADMCEVLKVSSSTLSHRFKELTGEAPASWIRKRRMTIARRMLQQGMSVVEVSERLGFANPFHFSRAFKAAIGVPPSNIATERLDAALHPPPST
jgi:AraC-like DNA-binding protein